MSRREGRVDIETGWCKGCGICMAFCPVNVLRLSGTGKAEAANPDQCTGCGLCERLCPDLAITVTVREAVS